MERTIRNLITAMALLLIGLSLATAVTLTAPQCRPRQSRRALRRTNGAGQRQLFQLG
jgi:hypothetical protein